MTQDADTLHLLGVMARQRGRLDDSLLLTQRAIEQDEHRAEFWTSLGNVLLQLGRQLDAISAYERALTERSNYQEATLNLAVALNNQGTVLWRDAECDRALRCFEQAVALRSDYAEARYNLGTLLGQLGRSEEALGQLRRALELRPDAPTQFSLGTLLMQLGNLAEARELFCAVLALDPEFAAARVNLANVLKELGDEEQALLHLELLVRSRPDDPEAHNNLAGLLLQRGEIDRACTLFRRLVQLQPSSAEAHANLGVALTAALQFDTAMVHLDRAVQLDPRSAHARSSRAFTDLLLGNLERGWADYEWRWQSDVPSSAPRWTGDPLLDQRLFVWAEQGLGDTLQFVRYIRALAANGADVSLQVQPELKYLVEESLPNVLVVSRGQPLPDHDLQAPLMSLPHLMGTRADNMPTDVPYLQADPRRIARWSERLGARDGRRRTGLVWAGSRGHRDDRRRSLAPELLMPLLGLDRVQWVSIQKGAAQRLPFDVTDYTSDLGDLAETAALVMNLDLVIAVDTAVAHLAGALGHPVWILLPHAGDWRWFRDPSNTPWYPTARLFRQPSPGDWRSVIDDVMAALQ